MMSGKEKEKVRSEDRTFFVKLCHKMTKNGRISVGIRYNSTENPL